MLCLPVFSPLQTRVIIEPSNCILIKAATMVTSRTYTKNLYFGSLNQPSEELWALD